MKREKKQLTIMQTMHMLIIRRSIILYNMYVMEWRGHGVGSPDFSFLWHYHSLEITKAIDRKEHDHDHFADQRMRIVGTGCPIRDDIE